MHAWASTFLFFILVLTAYGSSSDTHPGVNLKPQQEDPNSRIKIHDITTAELIRKSIIRYIWNNTENLPSTNAETKLDSPPTPNLFNADLRGVNYHLASKVERLKYNMMYDYVHTTYIIHPLNKNIPKPTIMLVHQGHQGGLGDGVLELINDLLRQGVFVAVTQMPMVGWNSKLKLKQGEKKSIGTHGHNHLFNAHKTNSGKAMSFFIEPIISIIDHVKAKKTHIENIGIVGLSGGGWTSQISSAVDERINLSVSIAGSYPLYLRKSYPGSTGDAEQIEPDLYLNLASYLDVYILGSIGFNREQVQIINKYDPCCFYGDGAEHYMFILDSHVKKLGGKWSLLIDDTHSLHQISPWARKKIIEKLIELEWLNAK
ncbi:hypothetical protein LL254_06885 [Marinobacter nauticus]|uniref:hypothetical protein n=1 Tax=Marinobacter nauticus TaxID=2743 RepID=UPI001D18E13A|nr:hypothetical protein [Marinobacter nauticus]MCC4270431.1 hypothetical protein [Marinobacter nauticus]